jgi:hypothetical protein
VTCFSHSQGGGGERERKRKRAVLLLFMQIDGWKVFQLHLPTVLPFKFLVTSSPFNIFLYLAATSSASDRWWILFSVSLIYPPLLQSKLLLSFLC